MSRADSLEKIQKCFESLSAAQVAELLLSVHVSEILLNDSTANDGPSMWIVNRSDVYDQSLEKLLNHPLEAIRNRAKEKLALRRSTLFLLDPPEIEEPFEKIPDNSVEDLLGHPLCPFEGMIYFSTSLSEDHRASSALSLTRRILEHPPNWNAGPQVKVALTEVFGKMLLEDSSAYARAFAARIPFLPASLLNEALVKEKNDVVFGRILQNMSTEKSALSLAVDLLKNKTLFFSLRVLALDERLSVDERRELFKHEDILSRSIHEWYLAIP